ncbi:MAG: 6-phosphofructokinase [Firmicutes bacterium]|nr:6-phosphofructokinase [Bacillota bacterium]
MKRIGVLTSGGDAPGMNAALRAVVRTGLSMDMEVYGISHGFEGLIDGEIEKMQWSSVGDILQRGGTILYSARSKRFLEEKYQDKAVSILKAFGIEGLVIIGGNGSFTGGLALANKGIPVMGVPGTIDNDLGYTDYTIGFDTAVNTVLDLISKIRDTSTSHDRATVIEVMGRHCGDIALHAGLGGGADFILIPEIPADIDKLCTEVLRGKHAGKRHSLILKAEGVDIKTDDLVRTLEDFTGLETRAVVPGYIQRGGSPTERDRMLASLMGAKAVRLLYNDAASRAVGITAGEIIAIDLEEALQMERPFNQEMYDLVVMLS